MNKLLLNILLLIFLASFNASAQKRVLGYVYDSKGNPLFQATLREEQTINGTVTDSLGYFELTVKNKESNIAVNYIGFIGFELKANENDTVRIYLNPYHKVMSCPVPIYKDSLKSFNPKRKSK